MSPTKMQA